MRDVKTLLNWRKGMDIVEGICQAVRHFLMEKKSGMHWHAGITVVERKGQQVSATFINKLGR